MADGGFNPGLHRAGPTAHVEPYRDTHVSMVTLAQKARVARHDPDLRRWAGEALKKAGIDGRGNPGSVASKCQAILDAYRAQTIYVPDPVGSEWIQAPHVTLCLRDMCIPIEDCDGAVLAVCGALLTIGLPAYLVKQEFGAGAQEHVLVGVPDERGQKLYVDPANTTAPVYSGSRASREYWVDPLEQVGETGRSSPDFVTLGAVRSSMSRMPQVRPQVNAQLQPYVTTGLGLVSVGDLDSLDAQVQAQVTSLDTAIAACTSLSATDVAAWQGFKAAWANEHAQWTAFKSQMGQWYLNPANPIVGVIGIQFASFNSDMRAYAAQLPVWWQRVKQSCASTDVPPGIVLPQQPGTPAGDAARALAEAIETAAKAVGAVLVTGVVVYAAYEGIKIVGPWLTKRRA